METRFGKDSDQQEVEKAFQIIQETMQSHPEIEPTLWASALWSSLVVGYTKSGVSHDDFCLEWDQLKLHYKSWFEGKDE